MDGQTRYSSWKRPDVRYKNECSHFTFNNEKPNYERQFNDIYQGRLDVLRPRIIQAALTKWGSKVPVRKLTDLYDNKDKCVIIGTIYKHQVLKPSVLRELADDASITPQPIRATKFTSENDKCILEDENLRVNLSGPKLNHGMLVTGVTVGVYGRQEESGSFEVSGLCFAGTVHSEIPRSLTASSPEQNDHYVLLLSGLNFRGNKASSAEDARRVLYCRLLNDWITGKIGEATELSKISRIVRLIIAGGSISEKCHRDGREYGQIARYQSRKATPPSVEAVKQLDHFLFNIAHCIDVDLIPGEHDPTNHMLPQQPFHKCLLPKSAQLSTLHQCTNPYASEIDGVSFLGTSGQNVDDILRFSTTNSSIAALESTVTWAHLCPSAPDTLDCYPYYDHDPFIIDDQLPNVYFAGNQAQLQSKLIDHTVHSTTKSGHGDATAPQKTLLLSLPKFNETGICALVNLRTLNLEQITFSADELFHEEGHQNGLDDTSGSLDTDHTHSNGARTSTAAVP